MRFTLLLCLTLFCGLLLPSSSGTVAAKERPNILFCLADDWGWPHAGAYGDRVVHTPTFDRLAREGVLFEHAFVSSPSCTPSRNAILTGQQFFRLGEGANLHSTLDVEHPNFMFLLRQSGYEIGHWRKAWGPGQFEAGGYEEHPCGPASTFVRFMNQRADDKPFCFWFGTSDPHRAYKPGTGQESGLDLAKIHVPEFFPDHETVRSDIADYYYEVNRWDQDVAAAIELLEKSGELENTIVVMSGDHGMPFPRCKGNLYDWGSRVPLAIRWGAKVSGGRRVTDFVSTTDLAPTFLEAAGVEVPQVVSGRSLIPLLASPQSGRIESGRIERDRDAVVYGRERHVPAQKMPSMDGYPARAIRTDRYLYIMNLQSERWPAGVPEGATHPIDTYADCDAGPTKQFIAAHRDDAKYEKFAELCFAPRPAEELYDVTNDPEQIHNLADQAEHRETVASLRSRLIDELTQTGDPRFTAEPAAFDRYPYRAAYLQEYIEQQQKP